MSQSTYPQPVEQNPHQLPRLARARLSEIDHYLSQAVLEQQERDLSRRAQPSVWQNSEPCP